MIESSRFTIESTYKSLKTEQTDPNQPDAILYKNLPKNLTISPDKITMGQGEYVVFHKLAPGVKKQLTFETFEKVYKIILHYSPAALINRISENAGKECTRRYELVKEKLKELDPTLEAVFVPRTLYELIFIRKCIKEDLKHKEICPQLTPIAHKVTLKTFNGDQNQYQNFLKATALERAKRKCWHLCYFTDAGDNEHKGVKEVAYRLNRVMFKAFNPSEEGFTYRELSALTEKLIVFLKTHHKNCQETVEKLQRGEKVKEISDCNAPGPTTNFGFESVRGSAKPMGIRNETDAQIIRDAIALECCNVAQRALFLYRGSNFKKDSTFGKHEKDKAYSLSYGTSLFAGCLYDGGATAFHYMRKEQNAYALTIPLDQLTESPFYVPTTHSVAQLFGDGEIFHARTKAWKDFDVSKIGGMDGWTNGHIREHLKSNLKREELITKFEEYKSKAIHFK